MQRSTYLIGLIGMSVLAAVSAGCSSDNPTSPISDTTAPTVNSTNPLNNGTGVSVISATFSEPMNASTITSSNFSLSRPDGTSVAGTVSYNPITYMASFTPTDAFAASTMYTATISVGSTDAAGNAMASSKVWNFTTSAAAGPPTAPPPPRTAPPN